MNEQQVEMVAKWLALKGFKPFYADGSCFREYNGPKKHKGDLYLTEWDIVGRIATACKSIGFWSPCWKPSVKQWSCRVYDMPRWSKADSPAEAAILAVASYLSANPTTTEK